MALISSTTSDTVSFKLHMDVLAPRLKHERIVVMDKLAVHSSG